jgi:hypothetical protein
MPYLLRLLFSGLLRNFKSPLVIAVKVMISLYGFWNLDFFKPFYSGFCLELDILPNLALDYAIALYPLFIVAITYLLIIMYDKNYRVITIMWSPFRFVFSIFRKKWDIRTSIVDAFATFFYLSNFKLLTVTVDFLLLSRAYTLLPRKYFIVSSRLFYAGDTLYFSREHCPFFLLALAIMVIFVIAPTMTLALYPFQWFQKCLNRFPVRCTVILHTLVDSFQGCYKDGTEPGTHDCRWFAAVFFVARAIHIILYDISRDSIIYTSLIIIASLLLITLIAIFQPFKRSLTHYNVIHIIFLLFLTLLNITENGLFLSLSAAPQYTETFIIVMCIFLTLLPLIYAIGIILHWMCKHRRFGKSIFSRLRAWWSGYISLQEVEGSFPDRIMNSGDYHRGNMSNFVERSSS